MGDIPLAHWVVDFGPTWFRVSDDVARFVADAIRQRLDTVEIEALTGERVLVVPSAVQCIYHESPESRSAERSLARAIAAEAEADNAAHAKPDWL